HIRTSWPRSANSLPRYSRKNSPPPREPDPLLTKSTLMIAADCLSHDHRMVTVYGLAGVDNLSNTRTHFSAPASGVRSRALSPDLSPHWRATSRFEASVSIERYKPSTSFGAMRIPLTPFSTKSSPAPTAFEVMIGRPAARAWLITTPHPSCRLGKTNTSPFLKYSGSRSGG